MRADMQILKKVSVVVATYNGEKYIERQLESVISQTRLPDEIIICDDKSEDHTVDIINRLISQTDISVKMYLNDVRLGFSLNFKQAIMKAEGEYIFLCDQDDVWEKNKIEECVGVLDKNPRIFSLATGFSVIDEDGFFKSRKKGESGKLYNISFEKFLRHPKYPGMSMVFRKCIWDAFEIDHVFRWEEGLAHDWAINYICSKNEGLYFLDSRLLRYRQHERNSIGILGYQKRECVKEQRVKMICGLITNLESVIDRNEFAEKVHSFQIRRLHVFKEGNVIKMLFFYVKSFCYISAISVLGDFYARWRDGRY